MSDSSPAHRSGRVSPRRFTDVSGGARTGAVDASDVLITSDDARAGHQASASPAASQADQRGCQRPGRGVPESCLSGHTVTAVAPIAGMMLHCGE
jgi:hypothetical protein